MTAPLLRVRGWAQRFENSRTRELRSLGRIPESTDLASDLYCAILDHPGGAAHYGVAVALHVVAAKSKPRGDLRREDGRSHDAQTLARVTRMPQNLIEEAIERLVEIGDLEIVRHKTREIRGSAWRNVATLLQAASTPRQDNTEILPANRIERTESSSSNRKNGNEGKEQPGRNGSEAVPDPKTAAPEFPCLQTKIH